MIPPTAVTLPGLLVGSTTLSVTFAASARALCPNRAHSNSEALAIRLAYCLRVLAQCDIIQILARIGRCRAAVDLIENSPLAQKTGQCVAV